MNDFETECEKTNERTELECYPQSGAYILNTFDFNDINPYYNITVSGSEDVSLLERCPHFRGWYVQASMELGPEDVSLLERCPHFRGRYVQAWDLKMCPY